MKKTSHRTKQTQSFFHSINLTQPNKQTLFYWWNGMESMKRVVALEWSWLWVGYGAGTAQCSANRRQAQRLTPSINYKDFLALFFSSFVVGWAPHQNEEKKKERVSPSGDWAAAQPQPTKNESERWVSCLSLGVMGRSPSAAEKFLSIDFTKSIPIHSLCL